jgi:dTDP-glucose pyrophosphorylase
MGEVSQVIALVLARGQGQRMRRLDPKVRLAPDQAAAAEAGWKALMPIGGRPYLDYVLSSLADAGYRHAGLVIGPEHREACRAYAEPGRTARVHVDLIEQDAPLGTADAVRSAETWANGSPFIAINGDNLYPVSALRDLAALEGPGVAAFEPDDLVRSGNIPAERIRSFALITGDESGRLTGIVEKPSLEEAEAAGQAALVSMNCWRFDSRIFAACAEVRPSARGELELTAAVGIALSHGVPFTVIRGRGRLLDLSSASDVAGVSRHLAGVEARP